MNLIKLVKITFNEQTQFVWLFYYFYYLYSGLSFYTYFS